MQYYTEVKKKTIDMYNMGESYKHCLEWKKPITKNYAIYDSIYTKFKKSWN